MTRTRGDLEPAREPPAEAVVGRQARRAVRQSRERLGLRPKPGAQPCDERLRARDVAVEDDLSDGHDQLARDGPEQKPRPTVEPVLPDDVAPPPPGQAILRRRALTERPGMRVDPD